jgi:LuxR family maltose regulon positive regulatory protein
MADAIRAVITNNRGNVSQAVEYARRALRRLPEDNRMQRSVVMRNLGAAYELQGNLTGASQSLSEAISLSQATDNLVITLQALNDLARLQVEQANLQGAAQLHQQALQWVKTWGQKQHQPTLQLPNSGLAYLGLAEIHREWHDLETAYQHAAIALDLGKQWSIRDTIQVAYVTLARILHARGDSKGANDAIQQATQGAQKQSPFTSWIAAMQTRFCLFQGDLATAVHWVEQCNLPLDEGLKFLQFPDEYATLVRVFLAQDQIQPALALLDQMHAQAEASGRTGRMIEISVLYALASYAQGDLQSAYAPLTRALVLAEPAGYMRIFVDEGAALAKLLRLAKSRGVALDYIDKLLAAFPSVEATASVQALPPGSSASLIEPLSERELQVLRLLSTGQSNQEIADELIVARGTAKKHLHNIFKKLGVRNRSQAILRAEELRLLK